MKLVFHLQVPFGLSLSKPNPYLSSVEKEEGKPFDSLRANGVGDERVYP